MEEEKPSSAPTSPTSPSSTSSGSRWNPTKEQISMLEALYRQGVRTPTADQIQQIAGKLREFGSIEGKNVFYWFQNHKARQRQKQKQESMAYLNRFFRRAGAGGPVPVLPIPHQVVPLPPPPPPSCATVVCSPYYFPQGPAIGYYPQFPQMLLPGAMHRRPPPPPPDQFQKDERGKEGGLQGHTPLQRHQNDGGVAVRIDTAGSHETLQLFPLHPTGILDGRTGGSLQSSSSDSNGMEEGDEEGEVGGADVQPVLTFV